MTQTNKLAAGIPIVDQNGAPTPLFMQWWGNLLIKVAANTSVTASVDLSQVDLMPPTVMTAAPSDFGVGPTV